MFKCSRAFFWIFLFFLAFLLNFLWEELHSVLYVHYQGGEITDVILLHASLADAFFITALLYVVQKIKKVWLFPILATLLAIGIEWWALGSNRWVYSEAMPIIPFLQIGLTPTIQLALTGTLTYYVSLKTYKKFLS
jgi:hypothetical protein